MLKLFHPWNPKSLKIYFTTLRWLVKLLVLTTSRKSYNNMNHWFELSIDIDLVVLVAVPKQTVITNYVIFELYINNLCCFTLITDLKQNRNWSLQILSSTYIINLVLSRQLFAMKSDHIQFKHYIKNYSFSDYIVKKKKEKHKPCEISSPHTRLFPQYNEWWKMVPVK